MKARSALSFVFVGTTTIGLASVAAAQMRVVDEGRFVVSKGGAPTRTETFKIERSAEGVLVARGQLSAGTQHIRSLLATDSAGTPSSYELDVKDGAGKPYELRATSRSGRLSSRSTSPTGDESMREFPLSAGRSVIVDAGLFHHLYFVVLGKSPGAVQVIEPRAMRSTAGTLRARGLDPVTIAGKSVTATRYALVVGNARYEFWVDAQGRILRVNAPDGLSATREELPR